jgi:predicted transcriptional regulator of viral defense system
MVYDQRSALSSFISDLLSKGRTVFAASEAEECLGIDRGAFLDAAERLQKRKLLLSPRRGFYVAVPPQFAAWGAPPPSWYIDNLMRHEGVRYYYVGLLKAAELHGATHQAVMEFQVITDKRIPKLRAGRNIIAFYFRKDMTAISPGIEKRKTDTGSMSVSSAALTALDLLRYPQASAGIDHIATVLSDLGREIDPKLLAMLSTEFERTAVQRLGCLLDLLGHGSKADRMHVTLKKRGVSPWTELDRGQVRDPDFTPEPVHRDERWRVVIRRMPEVDE